MPPALAAWATAALMPDVPVGWGVGLLIGALALSGAAAGGEWAAHDARTAPRDGRRPAPLRRRVRHLGRAARARTCAGDPCRRWHGSTPPSPPSWRSPPTPASPGPASGETGPCRPPC
ncbi:hypothetical protein LV779_28455 [Streptomyces thinghirensis]|nr:hypothetical protein [Streptomyces thinghirensis]